MPQPDPIPGLFDGRSARELFDGGEPLVCHGPVERLPACFQEGLLADVDHLCRTFAGTVQIANGNASSGGQLSVGKTSAAMLIDLGLTVAFDTLEAHIPGLQVWSRQLEDALGAPPGCVRAMAFANAKGTGLTLHHDVHDQLLIHLKGTKTLQWRPNEYLRNPSARFSHSTRPPRAFGANYQGGFPPSSAAVVEAGLESVVLQPGTVLFVPGGTWHTTAGQDERALSVAIVAGVPSYNEVLLNLLVWHMQQSPEGRRRAYGGWSESAGTQAELEGLQSALAERIGDLDITQAFDTWELERSMSKHDRYPAYASFERFIRLPFATLTSRPTDDGGGLLVRVVAGRQTYVHSDVTMTTMHECGPVVAWIDACGRAFSAAELIVAFPQVEEDELRSFLSALSQAQWIRPLPTERWELG